MKIRILLILSLLCLRAGSLQAQDPLQERRHSVSVNLGCMTGGFRYDVMEYEPYYPSSLTLKSLYSERRDIYGKGGKVRRIYFPKKMREEAEAWLISEGRESGYLFLNRFGGRITPRGISKQLKSFAEKYSINLAVVYPHSFRHRFAKNFLEKHNDISLLADLMGHESIETTRIYLRKTSSEQREIVDEVVTW